MRRATFFLSPIVLAAAASAADGPALDGEWRTSLGVVTSKADGETIAATFANARRNIGRSSRSLTPRRDIVISRSSSRRGNGGNGPARDVTGGRAGCIW